MLMLDAEVQLCGIELRQDAEWHPRVADEDSCMTLEPRHSPVVPSYGSATLADLSSSVLASLDPGSPDAQNVLGLAPAQRACLLIVDGFGWELLREHSAAAPALVAAAAAGAPRARHRGGHRGRARGAGLVPRYRPHRGPDARRGLPPRRQHGSPGRSGRRGADGERARVRDRVPR